MKIRLNLTSWGCPMNCTGLDDKKRTNKIMQIYNFGEKLDNQDENQLNDSERCWCRTKNNYSKDRL